MNSYYWYQSLSKPTWSPPSWVFGPVWSVLYVLITISFGYVFLKVLKKELPIIVAVPFILNLFFNFIFTYLQFRLQSNILASIDIVLVLLTLVYALYIITPHAKWVVYMNIPYLLWVLFATVLQLSITYLNR